MFILDCSEYTVLLKDLPEGVTYVIFVIAAREQTL